MAAALNYATEYSRALSQVFPYALNFGALYNTPNNNRYRWINSKTIEIPSLKTTGRVNANRDTISLPTRNYENMWETKTLTHERKWSTTIHPKDIDQTNMVAAIANITEVFNTEQKFPEMDAYTASKIYSEWTALNDPSGTQRTADTTALTTANILSVFDKMMLAQSNERAPLTGRILYVTYEVQDILKEAEKISRSFDVQSSTSVINRMVSSLDQVKVIPVPKELMETKYEFTNGWKRVDDADQINMMLINPIAVITPVAYEFARLDPPSALSESKYVYYEESHEDVFILNNKAGAIQFNITKHE